MNLSWVPYFYSVIQSESPGEIDMDRSIFPRLTSGIDVRLRNVFMGLKVFFSFTSKLAALEMMLSIQYRLLQLKFCADTQPLEDAISVGLLLFQVSIFLQMRNTRKKCHFLEGQLRNAIYRLPEDDNVMVHLKLWLVYMGSITVVDSHDPWLVATVQRLSSGLSWVEIRQHLNRIMWISFILDDMGKCLFEEALVICDTPGRATDEPVPTAAAMVDSLC